MTTGLFIGRFQPFHKGHLQDIKEALKEVDELIIAIGSSQFSHTEENPFSVEERIEMIEDTLIANDISDYTIFPIPDIGNDNKWVEHIELIVPQFDVVFTGNELTEKLFREKKYKVIKVKIMEGINGTTIRDKIVKNESWQELVPKEVSDFIKKINGIERIRKLKRK